MTDESASGQRLEDVFDGLRDRLFQLAEQFVAAEHGGRYPSEIAFLKAVAGIFNEGRVPFEDAIRSGHPRAAELAALLDQLDDKLTYIVGRTDELVRRR